MSRVRRSATSLNNHIMSEEEFKRQAFFPVIETSSGYMDEFGNWHSAPDKKAILNADTGAYISTVGKGYSIVNNQEFFERTIDKLTKGGIDFIPKQVFVEASGKRTVMVVKLPQFSLYPGSTEAQDFELRIRNSMDTTMSADALIGLLRLICTNGMTAFDVDFALKIHHKGDVMKKVEDSLELYQDFEAVMAANKARIEWLGDTSGTKAAVSRYIGDGETSMSSILKGERWAGRILEAWQRENETTNLWALYNIFTNFISHKFGHDYSKKLSCMEALNKEVEKWYRIMDVKSKQYVAPRLSIAA